MIASPQAWLNDFRDLVAARLGLYFDDSRFGVLEAVLRGRLQALRMSEPQYLAWLVRDGGVEETRELATRLTVGETYFLRNPDQFEALAGEALPELIRLRAGVRQLRLLSAACASGEEPYSLAITWRLRFAHLSDWRLQISGMDLNPELLGKARQGRYSRWSLREVAPAIRERFFQAKGDSFVLDPAVRAMVEFEERNLTELADSGRQCDLIFCRNVIMYLTPQAAARVVQGLDRVLAPGGYLFLGHAEALRGVSPELLLRHTHNTFYYQKPAAGEKAPGWIAAPAPAPALPAAARLEPPPHRRCPLPAPEPAPRDDLARVLDCLRQERFAEALAALDALPAELLGEPRIQLVRATLLLNAADLFRAESACRRLLAADDRNAGAHYLIAVCRERGGDLEGAARRDRAAATLDPEFAMPRLHLGLMAKRAGNLAAARDELAQALVLLSREDSARLLLFGGGFSREVLLAFAGSELKACGGPS